jgi:D-sedoheptulose 7-phosphate isomerase
MPESTDALVRQRITESIEAKQALLAGEHVAKVSTLAELVLAALRDGGKVILMGNGGSAADATHLAAEFVGRFRLERAPLPALSLTDNTSSVTAIGNDYGYEHSFSRQVRGLGRRGDVAIGLTTSGSSRNVVEGLRAAREAGLRTASITGERGGDVEGASDLCLKMPAQETARVQECTMVVGHTVCEIVEHALFAAS